MKAYELLDTKEKLIKSTFAKDVHGNSVHPTHPTAVQFCAVGALYHCYHPGIFDAVYRRLKAEVINVITWNTLHSYEEVICMLKKLDI